MTSIILPPLEPEDCDNFKAACMAIGDSLNAEIKVEEVISLKISWQNNRGDVAGVINLLAETKTKKKFKRGKDIEFGKPSDEFVDSKNL